MIDFAFFLLLLGNEKITLVWCTRHHEIKVTRDGEMYELWVKLKVVWKKAKIMWEIPYNAIERDWHDKNERNEDVVSLSISRESSIFSHHQAYNVDDVESKGKNWRGIL